MTRNLLMYIMEQNQSITNETMQANKNVVGSKEFAKSEATRLSLNETLTCVRALYCLRQTVGTNEENHVLEMLSHTATSRSTQSSNSFAAQNGYPFLEFLTCWSGLHRTPWPYCTQPEARQLLRNARTCLEEAKTKWGRTISLVERVLLTLGEADTEGGVVFDGGMIQDAQIKYKQLLQDTLALPDTLLISMVVCRCYSGLAQIQMSNRHIEIQSSDDDGTAQSELTLTRKGLDVLEVSIGETVENRRLYLWHASRFASTSLNFLLTTSRQLMANAMLRSGNPIGAQQFLEDAVRDAPLDASASFALGAFRLYIAFFGSVHALDCLKTAQMQLLRSAKLDPTKASPFALLGYWYEHNQDLQRAIGCYSKALHLDPSHPVAGRGILRLSPFESLSSVLSNATTSASVVSGWAWHAIGRQKAMVDGKDDLAVVSLSKALRCRDIERPEMEAFGPFFANPLLPELPNRKEITATLTSLAACYRRLGRYTAAIRTYHDAIHEARDRIPRSLLCSCAQGKVTIGALAITKSLRCC
jgi:tetratricopeptide (TPR) repeat protein